MSDRTILNKDVLDADGRQVVLDNSILGVHFYSYGSDTWDRLGTAGQSWFNELLLPNDIFDSIEIRTDRWSIVDTTNDDLSEITQTKKLNASIVRSPGIMALSSNNKWRLSGDFEVRLYFDWSSYYNEYRSITHSFLRVSYDNSNAARVSFTFDGDDEFTFSAEKIVDRDLTFFDWRANGSPLVLDDIEEAQEYSQLKIKRESGVLSFYASDGTTDTQIGESISDDIFSNDLYIDIGIENKEFNTYRHSFRKFAVLGTVSPVAEFFSSNRGTAKAFPSEVIIAVETESVSIIDESNYTLWSRILIGEDSALGTGVPNVFFSNGSLYCGTEGGLVVFDFDQDRIFKYLDDAIYISDEPLSLRNSSIDFSLYQSSTGLLPSNNITGVFSRFYNGVEILALATAQGVGVKEVLSPGISYSSSGELPANKVFISDSGQLYWSGFNPASQTGSLSVHSDVLSLVTAGTVGFNRTDYYDIGTSFPVFGAHITDFDVRTVNDTDQILIGTTEGITFISKSPGAFKSEAFSFGVEASAANPISDPSFDTYLGMVWIPETNAFVNQFYATKSETFATESTSSLRLNFTNSTVGGAMVSGTYGGVYQDVDLTDVSFIYYDAHITDASGSEANKNQWDLLFLVDDDIIKSHTDSSGTLDIYNSILDLSAYTGIHRFRIRIRMKTTTNDNALDSKFAYVDNFRTSFGNPTYRQLPPGQSSIKEVLLQYEGNKHKAYFSSAGGYGAIDLDDRDLDYFVSVNDYVPDSEVLSSDFSRTENES